MRLIFATYNPGKMDEVRKLGQKFSVDVVSLADVGVDVKFQETGSTFEENAKLKLEQAQAAFITNKIDWVAADDSGVEIDALGGEPGVKTRRWIGREMTDEEIIDYALERLKNVPHEQRTARFRAVIALGKVNTEPLVFSGSIDGSILLMRDPATPPRDGFPFRQIFFVPEAGLTLGQLDSLPADKQILTHRQQAFIKVFKFINDLQSLSGTFEES